MKNLLRLVIGTALLGLMVTPMAVAQNLTSTQLSINSAVQSSTGPITVVPFSFDPFETDLVKATWLIGTGCPTNATTNDGTTSGLFTDSACPTGDTKDKQNEGLLLVKTGPT